MASVVPIFPCKSLDKTLDFYETLGFVVTHRQVDPYLYGAVSRDKVILHFSKLTVWGAKNAVCLVFVPELEREHRVFADALRAKFGQVPTARLPRITRLRPGQTRFHVFDPAGNALIYISQDEPDTAYEWQESRSDLAQALENAIFLRDTYVNDQAAARVLDKALARHKQADSIDRARVLAARAELAVAMGESERAQAVRDELRQIPLSEGEREHYRHELQAADDLERWLTDAGENGA